LVSELYDSGGLDTSREAEKGSELSSVPTYAIPIDSHCQTIRDSRCRVASPKLVGGTSPGIIARLESSKPVQY
jgi:hypothetical protein